MLSLLAGAYDRSLCAILGRLVRRPGGGLAQPASPPSAPDEAPALGPIDLTFDEKEKGDPCEFRSVSAVPSFWEESRTLRGQALGRPGARHAVVVLHGACENEYTWVRHFGEPFARQEYRVLLPAAPCHLERAAEGTFSGAPLFWSTERVVAGMAQWLTEIRALIDWLHGQGTASVGIVGFSFGSLVGGLAATLWPDLDFVVLMAPVGHHLQAVRHSRAAAAVWPWMRRVLPAEAALLDRWAPLYRRPVAPRLLFLKTMYDVLQPTELQQNWWRAWGKPPAHEYPHGHMSVLFCRQMYLDLEAFAAARVRSVLA